MSLDVYLTRVQPSEVFSANITHNLNKMATAVSERFYQAVWRPEEIGITVAGELIEPLTTGLEALKADPERFRAFDSPNGWGTYKDFVPWLEKYLAACKEYPDAAIRTSR